MATVNGVNSTQEAVAAKVPVKAGLAQLLKGGVIMDVGTAEQARIAEEAGACAVMHWSVCRLTSVKMVASHG